ncbi:MAG: NAD-dependent epimerase/dehydratase family protein [Caulobacter sp.]
MGRSVLVTGTSGFLGAHVCGALAAAGWRVNAAVRPTSVLDRLEALCPSARPVDLDFDLAPDALGGIIRDLNVEAVVHCAAYGVDYRQNDTAQALAFNVGFTARLVEASAAVGLGQFVHIGTSNEYGLADGPIDETTPLNPVGAYGSSKAAGLIVARERAKALGQRFVAARVFGMYGPLEGSHKFVPQVMAAARDGGALDLTAGEQIRDYAYVGDVAEACVAMADGAGDDGLVVNLASGRPVTLRALGDAAAEAAGGRGVLNWGAKPYRPGEPMSVVGVADLARKTLGWSARTSLADGMALTAKYEPSRSARL